MPLALVQMLLAESGLPLTVAVTLILQPVPVCLMMPLYLVPTALLPIKWVTLHGLKLGRMLMLATVLV